VLAGVDDRRAQALVGARLDDPSVPVVVELEHRAADHRAAAVTGAARTVDLHLHGTHRPRSSATRDGALGCGIGWANSGSWSGSSTCTRSAARAQLAISLSSNS